MMPLQSALPAIQSGFSALSPSSPALLVKAATATGKSKLLPSALARQTAGRVLVLAPSTIDVVDMFNEATVSCSYQCGGGIRGGNLRSSRIHVVSVGLAVKQAAKLVYDGSSASSFFAPFSVVLFDEVHKTGHDPTYAWLLESALTFARAGSPASLLRLVLASATPSNAISALVPASHTVVCDPRPLPVECFRQEVLPDAKGAT